jgi:uncharacterized protein (TIGR03000 family)
MFARKYVRFAVPALAGSMFLLSAVPLSYAQDSGNGRGRSVPAFGNRGLATSYESYYSPVAGTGSQADQAVHIAIRVPGNAEVWFDGAKTRQTGESREFVSPPLASSRTYTYQIRTQWTEEGKTVDRTHRITVQAGDRIGLDLTNGSRTQTYDYGAISPRDENPGSFYPIIPRSTYPSPNVAPASEQSPMKGFGPPGSNHPYSLVPGHG